jgi:tyrosine-protein kinase Etk/Wzc
MATTVLTDTSRISDEWAPKRFDLISSLVRIVRRYRMIAAVTLVFAVLAGAYAFTRKPVFQGRSTFLPPQRDASLLGGLGGGGLLLGGGLFGAQQSAMYIGFLNSRSVQEDVVQRAHLMDRFHVQDADAARGMLAGKSKFDMETNGVITILIKDGDPQRAADIANAYLGALYDLNKRISQTTVAQRGEFYNDEVSAARASLEAAEAKLVSNQEQGGILDPAGMLQVSLSTAARLQASIQSAEVELSALLQSQTEQSPEVVRLRSRVGELRAQLAAQQSSKTGQHGHGVEAGGAIPRLSIEAGRRKRDVMEREAVYEAILRQADYTRLSSEDPGPQLQIIDRAVTPKSRSGPNRPLIILAGVLLGFIVSIVWAVAEPILRTSYDRLLTELKAG